MLGPTGPRIPSPRTPRVEDYDSSSSTESADTARNYTTHHTRPRTAFGVSTSTTGSLNSSPVFLFPPTGSSGRSSRSSTSSNTPVPSRSVSPLPQFYSSGPSSSCTSDTDSEPSHSPLLGRQYRNPQTTEDRRRRWWTLGTTSTRRRRKRNGRLLRLLKRGIRRLVRHPLFPSQPITIVRVVFFMSLFIAY
jgi:hypothetical protein